MTHLKILKQYYNPLSKVPKYLQIRESLRRFIESGYIKENQMLPTEVELCETFGVSRMTVRQAMDELVREGLLERKTGGGTFLKSLKIIGRMRGIKSFSEELISSGLTSYISIVSKEVVNPKPYIANKLQLKTKDKVIRFERVRYVDKHPITHETSYLPNRLCHPLMKIDLSLHSLQQTLTHNLGFAITNGTETVQTIEMNEKSAFLLQVPPKQPCFYLCRLLLTKENGPIEYVETVARSDKFMFVNQLELGG